MNFSGGHKRQRRVYENVAMVAVRKERVIALLWTRRGRKSTTLGNIGFNELSAGPGRTVIAASASLLLGTELISQAVTATDQAFIVNNEAAAMRAVFEDRASNTAMQNPKCKMQNAQAEGVEMPGLQFRAADSETGRVYGKALTREEFAELYQSKRLEMRLYFDRTNYSRMMVIAPNPATARGWGGTVVRDECGFTRASLETELQIAVDPIFRTDPTFKMIYASNLPRDDRHPYFEMTLPPPDMTFEPRAEGHFYRGLNRVLIHRVSLADAYAAGHVLYGNKGEALTYDQFCADPGNRMQLPGSYQLIHESGGTAVIDLVSMLTSQKKDAASGAFVFVDTDPDFERALQLLRTHLGNGAVGIGFDVASTTGETSNPSSVTVTEEAGVERIQRLVVLWKEKKPQVVRERLKALLVAVKERERGGPARRLCIDASNERLFAEETRDALAGIVPVELVMGGASVEPLPPGYQDKINFKTWLGDMYSAAINDGRYLIPSADYLKQDHRLVLKDAGRYVCDPQPDGKHGDTFDSGKLAEYALFSGGPFLAARVNRPAGREWRTHRKGLVT